MKYRNNYTKRRYISQHETYIKQLALSARENKKNQQKKKKSTASCEHVPCVALSGTGWQYPGCTCKPLTPTKPGYLPKSASKET